MPETAMNEDEGFVHREYEIWLSHQLWVVDTVTEPICVKSAPQKQLGLRVLAPNTSHHARASLFVYNISHLRSSFASECARIGTGL